MNLIIVANFLRSPKHFRLRDARVIGTLCGVLLLIGGSGAALGVAIHVWRDGSMKELSSVRSELTQQSLALTDTRLSIDRELNALAARLGQLQAQSTRLDALGSRLTRLGKLDDGEFNFGEAPALGGPESSERTPAANEGDIRASLEVFAARLSRQSEQLDVLESLMLDRDVESALLPSGRPVRSGYASSAFGLRVDPFTGRSEFHRGVDFNGPRGSDVLAVADGVVSFSGRHPGYGNMIDIDHGSGYVTRYAHNDRNLVEPGQRVRAGAVIGQMGNSGRATGVHVHFEVWLNDRPVNPYQYLRGARG